VTAASAKIVAAVSAEGSFTAQTHSVSAVMSCVARPLLITLVCYLKGFSRNCVQVHFYIQRFCTKTFTLRAFTISAQKVPIDTNINNNRKIQTIYSIPK